MDKPKPILVVKLPQFYDMHMVDLTKNALYAMEGLKESYFIIVATTDKDELTFEVSCRDDLAKVYFREFKKFKTIIENGQYNENFRADSESSKSEQ